MKTFNSLSRPIFFVLAVLALAFSSPAFSIAPTKKQNKENMRVSLIDSAPHGIYENVDKVVVNIKQVILKTNAGEFTVGDQVGPVDLMTLRGGYQFGIAHAELPVNVKVNQVRLILHDFGNYLQYKNGTYCNMKTPSQQKTGLKVVNPEFSINEGEGYALALDFNAQKSVVFRGNRSCLLKPVLKFGDLSTYPLEEEEEEEPETEEPVVEEPVVEEPVVEEPVVEEPVVEEPVVEEPIIEDPVIEEPVVEEPVVDEPVVEEPVIVLPPEEPVVEEPVVEEPVIEDPVVEEPVIEEPVVEEPVVEEPVIEEPIVEEPVIEEPVVDEPVVEEPVIEEPVEVDPEMEMCFNVDFDLFDSSTWPADFVYADYEHCY